MVATYRLSKAAANDLEEIRSHTRRQWGREQTRLYLMQLRERFRWLAESPRRGRLRRDLGADLRSYPEGQHIVFYRTADATIEVVRILHHRMDVGRHLAKDL